MKRTKEWWAAWTKMHCHVTAPPPFQNSTFMYPPLSLPLSPPPLSLPLSLFPLPSFHLSKILQEYTLKLMKRWSDVKTWTIFMMLPLISESSDSSPMKFIMPNINITWMWKEKYWMRLDCRILPILQHQLRVIRDSVVMLYMLCPLKRFAYLSFYGKDHK